ncbi:facilitated trehalose transporter Tret1-like [Chrysoperla carnea]|uniref:facilitated trehalose transporter Tret1-like n=1 Tax=Chrysoperla carnea TaxID=189513 RepID=UPI001D06779D|nr:facilitated trehalose transporter Tret1-like [Chrysoperla carnea]
MKVTSDSLSNNEKQCEEKSENVKAIYTNQYWISFAVSLMALNSGMSMGWISTALPKLTGYNSPIIITTYQGSWLVSLLEVGSLCGSIIATYTLDRMGRKFTLLLSAFPTIISSILYAIATNVHLLFIGRFLSGITVGANRSTIFLYISEISSPQIRGTLSSFMFMQLNIGLLLQFIIGSYLTIQLNSLLLLIIPIIFLITFIWIPESPYYYLLKDDLKSARKSIQLIRNGIIMSYVQVIFQQVDTSTTPQVNSIIVVSSVFISSWICTYFIDTWGRRPLFITSCIGVSIALFLIVSYLPVIGLLTFKIFESIGIGPITHICICELFSTNVKAIAIWPD